MKMSKKVGKNRWNERKNDEEKKWKCSNLIINKNFNVYIWRIAQWMHNKYRLIALRYLICHGSKMYRTINKYTFIIKNVDRRGNSCIKIFSKLHCKMSKYCYILYYFMHSRLCFNLWLLLKVFLVSKMFLPKMKNQIQ